MNAIMAGWRRRVIDGGLLLHAPDPMAGVVRIRTGVPHRPLREIVDEIVLPGIAGAALEPRAPARAFVTAEGEHAAIYELVARPPGFEIRRAIGFIIGDRDLVMLDGRAGRPEGFDIAEKVASLASAFSLGLGSDRWRPYYYAPPSGWHRLAHFQADVWLAAEFPKNPGTITVFHARPLESRAPVAQHVRLFEAVTAEFGQAEPAERQPVKLPSGLAGERVTFRAARDGRTRLATNVAVGDNRNLHLLRLETDHAHAAANGAVFARLVASVEPIPSPSKMAAAFDQWSE